MLTETNELLARLGYAEITPQWNTEHALDRPSVTPYDAAKFRQLFSLMPSRVGLSSDEVQVRSVKIVADDLPGANWIMDVEAGTISAGGDEPADLVLVASASDLVVLLQGKQNPASLLYSGRLRAGPRTRDQARDGTAGDRQSAGDVPAVIRALRDAVARA
jgi:putative sterol carrier protein